MCVFNLDLNSANVEAVLTDNGKLFHSLGPATAKARVAGETVVFTEDGHLGI